MVNVQISDDSYSIIRVMLAQALEAQMFNGKVEEWDGDLEMMFRALLELDIHADHLRVG